MTNQPYNSIPTSSPDDNRTTPVVSRPKESVARSILPTLALLLAAPLVAFALTMFVFQSYEVDGQSMDSTLQDRDRLIVWKLPKTWAKISGNPYHPERGEIVIFARQGLAEIGGTNKQLIKRVIGLPGERVVVSNGKITIYNDEHPEGFNPDINTEYSKNIAPFDNGNVDLVVGDDEVFVCGDNRPNSLDSRSFGTITDEDIVGKLAFRIFPANKFESFL